MTVLILDLDWMFDKSELPNVNCTKLSSFHKQRGDSVYFVGSMSDLTLKYDKLYICGESDSTPTVASKILNDKRTTLIGKKFELCGGKKLGSVIMGCRPDYLLYDVSDKDGSYAKANFVTFYTDNGEKIQQRQDWKNTKKGVKRTIVTDSVLWQQKPEEIEQCLDYLKNEKNIVFLTPVSLNFLVSNYSVQEKFLQLNFSKGTKFKWRNDVGSDENSAKQIAVFIDRLRQCTKSNIGAIPLDSGTKNSSSWQDDFARLMRAIAIFKQHKIKCFLPPNGLPKHTLIADLARWCEKNIENSFIEEMVFFNAARRGKRWFQIINDPSFWSDAKTRRIIQILDQEQWRELLPQMCVQWGSDSINPEAIDFKIIKKNAYMIM